MNKHTPGPWKKVANAVIKCNKEGNPEFVVCQMTSKQYKEQGQLAMANLKLIAAAPAMFEALEIAREYILMGDRPRAEAYQRVVDAISLAKKGV